MLKPDGRLWIDRLSSGLDDTGCKVAPADAERIVRPRRYLVHLEPSQNPVPRGVSVRVRPGAPIQIASLEPVPAYLVDRCTAWPVCSIKQASWRASRAISRRKASR
jgi:hypothetical protein